MKKIITAIALMTAVSVASALEVGVQGGYNFASGNETPVARVSAGTTLQGFNVRVAYERNATVNAPQYELAEATVGLDVFKNGPLAVGVNVGAAYVDPKTRRHSYAAVGGVEGKYSLTKNVVAVAEYRYMTKTSFFNTYEGSTVTAGLRYRF